MTNNRRQFLSSMTGLAGLTVLPAIAAPAKAPYKDASLPVEKRVDDLLGRMTLDEKIMQLHCTWLTKVKIQDDKGEFVAAKAQKEFPNGMGMLARPSDRRLGQGAGAAGDDGQVLNRTPLETANYINAAQKWAMEQTRLGVPMFMHEEALHGYVARHATCFPQAIGIASSFDTEMTTKIFSVAARQMRAAGSHLALAPVVDVAREPRWGRIEETFGEDPYVCGEMGKAAILGFAGTSPKLAKDKVFVTLKHMTGHGQPENGTNTGPAEVTERTLREEFFPPFERAIKESNVGAVMPSYNEIGGVPSHANHWLLTRCCAKSGASRA
jgi:beta-glucosidase